MKMNLFGSHDENRVRCGKCGTEFDIGKNKEGCPLCGFGQKVATEKTIEFITVPQYPQEQVVPIDASLERLTRSPPKLDVKEGQIASTDESRIWGSWLMFNSFFPGKLLMRVIGSEMNDTKKEYVPLYSVLGNFILVTQKYNLSRIKGFPDLPHNKQIFEAMLTNFDKVSSLRRLVHHFLRTFANLGLITVRPIKRTEREVWGEKWENLEVGLAKSGLEFAQLKSAFFDDKKTDHVFTEDERRWLISYLKRADERGYKEFSVLKEVYLFFKSGKKDLVQWFCEKKTFRDYVLKRSERASSDEKIFEKQLANYARTFSSSKISLLRELGIVRDKRNDYTVVGTL